MHAVAPARHALFIQSKNSSETNDAFASIPIIIFLKHIYNSRVSFFDVSLFMREKNRERASEITYTLPRPKLMDNVEIWWAWCVWHWIEWHFDYLLSVLISQVDFCFPSFVSASALFFTCLWFWKWYFRVIFRVAYKMKRKLAFCRCV